MQLLSVNIGSVGNLAEPGKPAIPSAYDKRAVADAVRVTRMGLDGDAQVDRRVHGGIDKAIYAYPFEHYAFWQMQRRAASKADIVMPYGFFAENLTISGLREEDIWIGDRLQIGEVLLEVTEPRQPCFKFAIRMGWPHAVALMMQSSATGFYLKVIDEGRLQAGQHITVHAGPRQETVAQYHERRRQRGQKNLF